MPAGWRPVGAAVALASELGALAALAFWGAGVPGGVLPQVLAGIGLPAVAALLWGLFAAPRAPIRRPLLVVATKVLVYGAAAWALAATGHPVLAAVLALAGLLGSVPAAASPPVSPPRRS